MSFVSRFMNLGKYNPGQPTVSGFRSIFGSTRVDVNSSMKVSAYYRGVMYIATQVAKLPIHIKDETNQPVFNRDTGMLLRVLNKVPNPEMHGFTFWCYLIISAINRGNGYAEIIRDKAGRIVEMYPIHPDHVTPFRDTDNNLKYRIIGGSRTRPGEDYNLDKRDIFHLKNPNTNEGIFGISTIHNAAESLGVALGAEKFSNGLYSNGGMPSGVLKAPNKLSPEAAERLKSRWDERFGDKGVGGTAVLEEGLEYSAITLQPDQLQFIETKKFTVPTMARFLGVSPVKLYDTDAKATKVEDENLISVIDTVDPWVKNIEAEVDLKFFNGSPRRNTEFDIYAVFRGDMNARSTYYHKMMQSSAITPNEIRKKEGMPPYAGGDRFYIATNNYTPVDRLDEVIDNQTKPVDNTEDDKLDKVIENLLTRKL
jgi:HK97 family phage portal protein